MPTPEPLIKPGEMDVFHEFMDGLDISGECFYKHDYVDLDMNGVGNDTRMHNASFRPMMLDGNTGGGDGSFFDENEHQFMEQFLNGFLLESGDIPMMDDNAASFMHSQSTAASPRFSPLPIMQLDHLPPPVPTPVPVSIPLNIKFYPIRAPLSTTDTSRSSSASASKSSSSYQQYLPGESKSTIQSKSVDDSILYPADENPNDAFHLPTSLAPGCVPAPVLAPRKKRHSSREQLTESEKKANHIASEQKRRRNIRLGFCALTQIIPDLREFTDKYITDDNETAVADEPPPPTSGRKRQKGDKHVGMAPSKAAILERTAEYIQFMELRIATLTRRWTELSRWR